MMLDLFPNSVGSNLDKCVRLCGYPMRNGRLRQPLWCQQSTQSFGKVRLPYYFIYTQQKIVAWAHSASFGVTMCGRPQCHSKQNPQFKLNLNKTRSRRQLDLRGGSHPQSNEGNINSSCYISKFLSVTRACHCAVFRFQIECFSNIHYY